MMNRVSPIEQVARDVVRRARDLSALETSSPDALEAELVLALTPLLARTSGHLDEETTDEVIELVQELLFDSPSVEEVFAEDAKLERIVRAALMEFGDRNKVSLIPPEPSRAVASRAPQPKAERATIADAGFPFPLFEGPLADAEVDEPGPCAACGVAAETRFNEHCYPCFRAGKAPLTKDTEYGMVRPEDAAAGVTHGTPIDDPAVLAELDVASVEETPEGRWTKVRFSPKDLDELVRTPSYGTWQGESWLFCCKRPMVYVGALNTEHLESLREGDATAVDVLRMFFKGSPRDAELLTADLGAERVFGYGFRCNVCAKRRAHFDRC